KLFTALRAELCFKRHVIFTISLREIVKTTCRSEEYSAAVGGKRLFTQPIISQYSYLPNSTNLLFLKQVARRHTKWLLQAGTSPDSPHIPAADECRNTKTPYKL
ncbi:MAG: hypothetical protein ACOYOO_15250, partial [Saprospiraceae bacterium]